MWADILSLKECPIPIWQSSDFGSRTPQFIPGNKQITFDLLIANRKAVEHPSYLQSYPAGSILSIMNKLAGTCYILTWSLLYIPQDFPLLFFIIFLSYSTPPNHGCTNTSARRRWIRHKPINWRFIQYITPWHSARTQTPVSPPRRWQWSHQHYDLRCTFQNRP